MKHIFRYGWVCAIVAATVVMCFLVQHFQMYCFYELEHKNLFFYDWHDIMAKLSLPGGFATLSASFLMQFAGVPYVAAAVVALCYGAVMLLLGLSVRADGRNDSVWVFTLLPVALLAVAPEHNWYLMSGLTSFVMALVGLWLYTAVYGPRHRTLWGAVTVAVLYYAAGSAALVFAFSAWLFDVLHKREKMWKGAILLALFFVFGFVAERLALVIDYASAFTPAMYYEWPVPKSPLMYAWISVPAVIVLSWLLSLIKRPGVAVILLASAVGAMVCFVSFKALYAKNHDTRQYAYRAVQYFAEHEDWERVIRFCSQRAADDVFANYLCMALAQRGELLDGVFGYGFTNLNSLFLPPSKAITSMTLLSRSYYNMGYIMASLKNAFETNQVTHGGYDALQLQLLVKTNIVMGAYDVAEKYISILESTLRYRGWAKAQRRFLNNDAAVESDPELGEKRRSLPQAEHFMVSSILFDLKEIIDAEPRNSVAMQYYEAVLLLAGKVDAIQNHVEEFYGGKRLNKMPKKLQEAVVLYCEGDKEYCAKYGVSDEVLSRLPVLDGIINSTPDFTRDIDKDIRAKIGDTYWYYLLSNSYE